jgi:hypothetical protein
MIRSHVAAISVGIGSILLAAIYGFFAPVFGYHVEWAGVTMLFALGFALAIMFYVLHTED